MMALPLDGDKVDRKSELPNRTVAQELRILICPLDKKIESMRSSNKSRSRNKNNNRRNSGGGNVVNRVFDSAGPEGRVRGTPQQIIEKYRALAHDALLADDRVSAESFQQHAEHYARMLIKAQRQQAERQAEQQAQQAQRQNQQQAQETTRAETSDQPEVGSGFEAMGDPNLVEGSGLVPTPESKPNKPRRGPRQRRKPEQAADKSPVEAPVSE